MHFEEAVALQVLVFSENPRLLQIAEDQITQSFSIPGFHILLFNMIEDQLIPECVRKVATIILNCNILKYWEDNVYPTVPKRKEKFLRRCLLSLLNKPMNQIPDEKAYLMSIIIDMDWQGQYNQYESLFLAVDSIDDDIQLRALLTLDNIVDEFHSKKFDNHIDEYIFKFQVRQLFPSLMSLWKKQTDVFMEDPSAVDVTMHLRRTKLLVRILIGLSLSGWIKKPDQVMKGLIDTTTALMQCSKQLGERGIEYLDLCESYILHLTEVSSFLLVEKFLDIDELMLVEYYSILKNLLAPNQHMAVRERAMECLGRSIGGLAEGCDTVRLYVSDWFDSLFIILKDCRECETKAKVLNVMIPLLRHTYYEGSQSQLKPLVGYLHNLWLAKYENCQTLRIYILKTFTHLLRVLEEIEPETRSFLFSIIHGLDTSESEMEYLKEHLVDLHSTFLEYFPHFTRELSQFNNLLAAS